MTVQEFYQKVSDLIDSSQARGDDMYYYLLKMKDILENSEINNNDLDAKMLIASIDSTINIINDYHIEYSKEVLIFVRNLQKTILNKYNYKNINEFLENNMILVGNIFADISNSAGYPINSNNIRDIS